MNSQAGIACQFTERHRLEVRAGSHRRSSTLDNAVVSTADTFAPGTPLLDGRFVISRVIASGGQATTYEGIDKSNGTRVAIKRFSVRGASSWKEVELAERETRVLSGLSHSGLPKVVSHFEEQGALYLVLEFIEGSTLEQLRTQHRLAQEDVVDYLRQVAEILDYLHSQSPPIVHRDIKPRNLIRRPDGKIVLVDFGSVRDRLKPEGGSTVVGTFGYMAPEQFQGRAMPASDTYGAAATALALLTGREPDQLPHQGLKLDVERCLGGSVSPELERLLSAALDPDPDTRPASLKAALNRYQASGRSPSAAGQHQPRESGHRRAEREERRRRRREARHGPEEAYADYGQAPFETPGYHRARTAQSRAERRREQREAKGQPHTTEGDIDVVTPFAQVLAMPEVRRVLRVPVLGLIALVLLMVLRTVLWLVLGVAAPRVLHALQRVTGASLDDAAKQTGLVGTTLRTQLSEVTDRVRRAKAAEAPPRYRVSEPSERSRYDALADDIEARTEEFEAEIEEAVRGWNKPRKK